MTEEERTAGFWSYSREDDASDRGRILGLASDLAQEFNLIAGRPLKLFLDRETVEWGEEWRSRIDSSVGAASFFIAVVTPRYFRREECRRELLEFYGQAKSSGLEKLLLPIFYIDVPELRPDNDDEVVSIVARTQHVDWRTLRLSAPDSSEHRVAVNKLAQHLLKIEVEATSILIAEEAKLPADEPGVNETVAEIQKLLPAWLESVMGDKVNRAQIEATLAQHKERIGRLRARGAPRNAILATELRLGPDLLPLVEKRLPAAKVYLSRSAELDSLILRLIRQLKEFPRGRELAADILFAIEEAVDNITSKKGDGIDLAYLQSLSKLSQTIHKTWRMVDEGHELIRQGNDIVGRWWNTGVGPLLVGSDFVPLRMDDAGWWRARPARSA